MAKNRNEIFSKFNFKAKKQKQTQKQLIEHAKEIGRQMEESKKKSRQDFMNKLLINAVEMNKAREDWDNLDNINDHLKQAELQKRQLDMQVQTATENSRAKLNKSEADLQKANTEAAQNAFTPY